MLDDPDPCDGLWSPVWSPELLISGGSWTVVGGVVATTGFTVDPEPEPEPLELSRFSTCGALKS